MIIRVELTDIDGALADVKDSSLVAVIVAVVRCREEGDIGGELGGWMSSPELKPILLHLVRSDEAQEL